MTPPRITMRAARAPPAACEAKAAVWLRGVIAGHGGRWSSFMQRALRAGWMKMGRMGRMRMGRLRGTSWPEPVRASPAGAARIDGVKIIQVGTLRLNTD